MDIRNFFGTKSKTGASGRPASKYAVESKFFGKDGSAEKRKEAGRASNAERDCAPFEGPAKKPRVESPAVKASPQEQSWQLQTATKSTAAVESRPDFALRRSDFASPPRMLSPLPPVTPDPSWQKPELESSPLTNESLVRKKQELVRGPQTLNGVSHGSLASDSNQHKRVSSNEIAQPDVVPNSWQAQPKSWMPGGSSMGRQVMGAAAAVQAALQQNQKPVIQNNTIGAHHASVPQHQGALQGGLAPCSTAVNKGKNKLEEGPKSMINELWTTKHRPRKVSELVGNGNQIHRLREWLLQWESRHLQPPAVTKGNKKAAGSSSGGRGWGKGNADDEKKAVLLSGPPGLGKTSSASILCQELGYEVMEVNASDARGKAEKDIRKGMGGSTSNQVKELITNRSLSGSGKKLAIIMDEVDGMSGGDRGGVQELIQCIQKSRIPIICICNDKYSQKIKSLVGHCMKLNFQKPSKQQIGKRLGEIAAKEGMHVDERALDALIESVQCDIRLALNHLQFMRVRSSSLNYQDVQAKMKTGAKDVDLSPFNVTDKLFSPAAVQLSLSDQINLAFADADLLPLMVQENYVNFRPGGAGRDRMDAIASCSAWISDGDLVSRQVRGRGRWDLMPFGCVASTVASCAQVRGQRENLMPNERNFNRFSAWLGKNSSGNKSSRILAELQSHMLVSGNCSATRSAVRQDYMPFFNGLLTAPLRKLEKEGVEPVIGLMNEYSLTREDWGYMLDLGKLTGKPDPLEGVSAQVKGHFTRQCTANAAQQSVKSSVMLDMGTKGAKGRARVAPVENEVVAGDEAAGTQDDEEGEGSEEDDTQNAAAIPGVTAGAKRQAASQGIGKGKAAKREPKAAAAPRGRAKENS